MNNSSVFVRKPSVSNKVIGTPVASYYGHRIKTGTVGIEIELEGANFPKEDEELPDEWQYHEDHSLRGEDNAEYVLRLPESFATAEDAVRRLFCVLDDNCVVIDDSPRTSVHVHLNFQKNCVNRIAAFSALFFTVEEILSEWCGDHRAGNLFCLRAKDAPAIPALAKEIVSNNLGVSISSDYHYAGLNFESLQKFGSLEVRHMRGPKDAQEVIDWLKIVQRIYDMSDVFKSDPREICYKYSYEGPSRFFKDVFGPDLYPVVLAGLSEEWNEQKINDSVREGIRIAQDICSGS